MADLHSTVQQRPISPVDYESAANHRFSVFNWSDNNCDIYELYTKTCFYPTSQEFKSKLYAAHLMVLFESAYCCWTVKWLFLQTSPHSIWDQVCPLYLLCSGENTSGVNGLQGYNSRQ